MQTIVGLTGPIAAGKNAAATLLQEKGYAVIDADIVAHQILEEKQDSVIAHFSQISQESNIPIQNEDGSINRQNLGRIVFSSKKVLQELEAILYPPLTKKIESLILQNKDKSIIINAAALHKTPELLEKCTFFLYVYAHPIIRFFRIKKRNKMPIMQILQRFYAQKQLYAQYIKKNVDIYRVSNNKKIIDLEQELNSILDSIK